MGEPALSDSSTPPSHPWREDDPTYRLTQLLVKVIETDKGWVFSEHDYASEQDARTASEMRGHGVKQIAYALTTEAFRREGFLCLLAEMTKHADVLKWYTEGDDGFRTRFEERLTGAALATIMGLAQKMLPEITREVIAMALSQTRTGASSSG